MTEKGFTMVELLVVLIIMGMLSAAVVLTLPRQDDTLDAAAQSLAARLHLAGEDSVLSNTMIEVRFGEGGSRFHRWRDGRWQDIAAYSLPGDVTLASPGPLRFDPLGGVEPAMLTLERHGERRFIHIDGQGRVRLGGEG